MRRLLTLVLISAVVALQMGSRWIVYAAFKANQAYIEAELCENRDAPELECHGQCHLQKELRKTEDQAGKGAAKPLPEFAPAPMPEPVCLQHATLLAWDKTEALAWPPYAEGSPAGYAAARWQPPGA